MSAAEPWDVQDSTNSPVLRADLWDVQKSMVQAWEQNRGMCKSQYSPGLGSENRFSVKPEERKIVDSQFWDQHLLECVENSVHIWNVRRP